MKQKYNLFFLAIGLIAIAIMIADIGIGTISDNIKKTSWFFLAIIAVRLPVYFLNTLSWQKVSLHPKGENDNPNFWRFFQMTISGYAINYITPVVALGGEPYRILRLKDYVGYKRATSSVVMYAVIHILSHFIFWAIGFGLILFYPDISMSFRIVSIVFILICILAALFISKFYRKGIVYGFFCFLMKIPFIKIWARKKMTEEFANNLKEIDFQIKDFYINHRKAFLSALFLETLSRIVGCLEILLIMLAIDLKINLVQSIIISAGTSLFANILFFSPMQLGTKEGGLILSLKSIALPATQGIYIGLAMRISELFWIILGVLMIKFCVKRKAYDVG